MVTYNMNILQGITAPETFCVTLNNSEAINPVKVLGRSSERAWLRFLREARMVARLDHPHI